MQGNKIRKHELTYLIRQNSFKNYFYLVNYKVFVTPMNMEYNNNDITPPS